MSFNMQTLISRLIDFVLERYKWVIILFVLLGVLTALFVRISNIGVVYADITGLETTSVVYFIQQLLVGNQVYYSPEVQPYSIAQYPPLYYWLCAGIGKVLGLDPYDPISIFKLSRSVSFVCNMLVLLTLALIAVKHFKIKNWWLFPILGICFMFFERQHYSRPDSLYFFFYMASVYWLLFLASANRVSWKHALLFGVFSGLTIFSKQSGFILPLVAVGYLVLFRKQWINSLLVLLGLGVTAGIVLLSVKDLHALYQNNILGLSNGIDIKWYYKYLGSSYLPFISPLIILSLSWCVYILLGNTKKHLSQAYLLALLIIAQFVFANGTALKYGSGPNYFQEFFFLSSVILAFGFKEFERSDITSAVENLKIGRILITITILAMVSFQSVRLLWDFWYKPDVEDYQASSDMARYFAEEINDEDAKVFVFATGWVEKSFCVNFLFDKAVMINKDIYGQCWERDVYDLSTYESEMCNGEIGYVLLPKHWQEIFYLDKTYSNFQTVYESGPYKLASLQSVICE